MFKLLDLIKVVGYRSGAYLAALEFAAGCVSLGCRAVGKNVYMRMEIFPFKVCIRSCADVRRVRS